MRFRRLPMLKEIGIDGSMARRLMQIGRTLANRASYHDLPSSVFALYELSRLDSSDIKDGIESGYDKGPGDDAGAVGKIEDASLAETMLRSSRAGGAVTVSPERVA